MIIVEGIDRVGKTTLVNLINKKTGLPILNDTYIYNSNDMREDKRVNTEKIQTTINFSKIYDKFIVDRLHWSELVYGIYDRGYNNTKDCMKLEEQLVDLDAKIILVVPTNINSSSLQHGKDLLNHNKMFIKLYKETKMKKFICNYNTLSNAVDWVIENWKI